MVTTSGPTDPTGPGGDDRGDTPYPGVAELETLLVSVEEAAHLLRVNRSTVYNLLGCGELPSVKVGRRRLIARQSLVHFVHRRELEGQRR